jgi:hypothetical protein
MDYDQFVEQANTKYLARWQRIHPGWEVAVFENHIAQAREIIHRAANGERPTADQMVFLSGLGIEKADFETELKAINDCQ